MCIPVQHGTIQGSYIYIYTTSPVSEKNFFSETAFSRKPNVCPGFETKSRKPLWPGLPSNNEMKIFGLRRCDTYPILKYEKCKNINMNLNKLKSELEDSVYCDRCGCPQLLHQLPLRSHN